MHFFKTLLVNFTRKVLHQMRQRGPQIGAPFKVPSYLLHPLVVPSIRFQCIGRSFALEHSIANLVVSYIRFNAYDNGMGTSLIASLATHRSICHCVASLLVLNLPPGADRFAHRSELVVFLACARNDGFRSSARRPMSSGLRPCGGAGNLHPLRSTLIDVCLRKHQWLRSVPGFLLP